MKYYNNLKYIIPIVSLLLFANCAGKIGTSNKNDFKKNAAEIKANKTNILVKEAIDYFAEGNEPTTWQIKINFKDTVRFTANDGLSLKFAFNQLTLKTVADELKYSVNLKSGIIGFTIENKPCNNNGLNFTNATTFTYNNKTYKGCGQYIENPLLNGIWILEKIKNTNIDENKYNIIPTFKIDLVNNSLKGNDGCNNIYTDIKVLGKQIKFGLITSTKKRCDKKDLSLILKQSINNEIVAYYFKNEKLYLYLNDDSELIFKRKVIK